MSNYKHWTMRIDAECMVWLGFNRQDATVNSINDVVLALSLECDKRCIKRIFADSIDRA